MAEAPNLDNCKLLRGSSRADMERHIDAFLSDGQIFKDVPLALPLNGANRYVYRGVSIREWHHAGNVRFDAAVEVAHG